jgi:hypothetical protein
VGTLTSWNPLGHSRPFTGLLYLYPLNITGKRCGDSTDKLKAYRRKRDAGKGTDYDSASVSKLVEL